MSRLPVGLVVVVVLVLVAVGCGGGTGGDDGDPVLVDAPAATNDAPVGIDAPSIDAPPPGVTCAMKDPVVQLGFTCQFVWSACSDQQTYELNCRIQNVGGNVFSLCDCKLGGAQGNQFISTTVCGSTEWAQVEAVVDPECGWMLR